MNKRKVVALLRVSTLEQSKGDRTGIERQQADIDFYCMEYGLDVVETFAFDGISGAIVTRTPRFKEMIALLKKPHIAGVVFASLDRFCRPDDLTAYKVFEPFVIKSADGKGATKKLFCDAGEIDATSDEGRDKIIRKLEEAASERRRIKYRTMRAKEILRKDASISIDRLPKACSTSRKAPRRRKALSSTPSTPLRRCDLPSSLSPRVERSMTRRES
jgi:DNA invertase Pin-like site-specific DNA recombinase